MMKTISRLLGTAAALACAAAAADLSAADIMARVAENQERSVAARTKWVYDQDELVRVHYTNGKIDSEEHSLWVVTPTPDGVMRTLKETNKKDGRANARVHDENQHSDRPSWFPLTKAEHAKYDFTFVRESTFRERPVYEIAFKPRGKVWHDGTSIWAGEVIVDKEEFQPALIT